MYYSTDFLFQEGCKTQKNGASVTTCAKLKRNIVGYFKADAKVSISPIPATIRVFRLVLNKHHATS